MPINLQEILGNEEDKKVLLDWAEREVVAPVKAKNSELLDKLVKYKLKTEDGKETYIDPNEAVEAIKKVKEAPPSEDRKKWEDEMARALQAQQERLEAQLKALSLEKESAVKEVSSERQSRYNLMATNTLRSALVDSGVKTTKMHLHEQYLRGYVTVEMENGQERVVVKDENGKIRYGSSGLMSVSEFVNEYREKDGVAEDWNATTKQGAGTGPSGGGGRMVVDQNLPPSERLKQFRAQQAKKK